MKIYMVQLDCSLVMSRLRKFNLREFNSEYPILFAEAADPDEACYLIYCKFSETILKQDDSVETARLINSALRDIRITKVYCKDEKKL
jgi:hypothetical protein